ncbi:MAG: proline--tRNA ligase [bacterium]|nr:proline--tRNA ligase [bacterium]
MKLSRAFLPTLKETPADAVIPSHRLMIRAGLIRPLAAGVYSILPLGWKVLKKIMAIVREEMDRIGGQELHMPALNPAEIWDETGRNADFGDEIFRLKDRKDRPLVLAPTHEEIICDLARKFVKSYKDLPQMWYQIQNKFRDEPRPRSGVIRTRQFFMKDSYSLDSDEEGLDLSYRLHADAYRAIFSRCGLDFHVVGASSGLMGGKVSQEFMFESEFGEDTLAICECGYAANLEVASARIETAEYPSAPLQRVETPGKRTIGEVAGFLKKEPLRFAKAVVMVADGKTVMVLVRGDHELNENKLQSFLGAAVRPAHPEEILAACGAEAGFVGPVQPSGPVRILADQALAGQRDLVVGANLRDHHYTGAEPGRDFKVDAFGDFRNVSPGDACVSCGRPLRVANAIELGHIFKLGTKYSSAMKATFLDRNGKEKPIIMGSYGIGIERILAAAIEQGHDEKGLIWNSVLTPYHVHLIPVKMDNPEIVRVSESLYGTLGAESWECLLDDRSASPGFKFKDADLIGIPLQVVIGDRWIREKKLELRIRRTGETTLIDENELSPRIRDYFGAEREGAC